MTIRLAEGLALKDDAATQVFAFMGRRGSGKTFGAGRLVEQLHDHGDQVVILDPVGVWWGLRLAADGKAPGLEIPVFGGLHGDIPLEAPAGKVVAELVAERGTSLVLDVSGFTLGDQRRFVTDFAVELFHAKKAHRSPLMVVFEEAQEFAPQHVGRDQARMVGAVERLVKLGRNFGVGAALISQRPQAVNKDVLNLTECLLAFQLAGPQERKAIQGWVQEKGAEGRDEVGGVLPSLPVGTAMIWSPQWLGHFGRHKLLAKKTFDASATPTAHKQRAAATLAPIDLEAVKQSMAATIERAKAEDPAALKAEVAKLRKELATATKGGPAPQAKMVRVEVKIPFVPPVLLKRLRKLRETVAATQQDVADLIAEAERVPVPAAGPPPGVRPALPIALTTPAPPVMAARAPNGESDPLGKAARALLTALAQKDGRASDVELSALSGYRRTSSTFANALTELRLPGFVIGSPDGRELTDAGRRAAGAVDPPPTRGQLLDWWLNGMNARGRKRLGKCEGSMLQVLFELGTVTREELSRRTGYRTTSSTFANGLTALRKLGLAHGPDGGDLTIAEAFREG